MKRSMLADLKLARAAAEQEESLAELVLAAKNVQRFEQRAKVKRRRS